MPTSPRSFLCLSLRSLAALVLFGLSVAYTPLSDSSLLRLPSSGSDFDIHTGALLAPILQPRVPGSPGSTAVLNHFVNFFRTTLPQWDIRFQNSTSKTPVSGNAEVPFVNLIAIRDPPWAAEGEVGRLTLVAHYDSKLTPPGFIGATDSAAPCAIMMHAARSVDDALTKKWKAMEAEGSAAGLEEEVGVQIIFLDGEEAFLGWTDEDSLYGARSLAETWEQSPYPPLSTYKTPLSSIALFVLLDLLGSANPTVPSYFRTTHWAYRHFAALETRLRALSLFQSSPNHPNKRSLSSSSSTTTHGGPKPRSTSTPTQPEPSFLPDAHKYDNKNNEAGHHFFMIQDDHVPFMARGVEVLHLIPYPFPHVWHEPEDDGEHLDLDTVEDWARLVTAFVAEWMDLEGFFLPVTNKPAPLPQIRNPSHQQQEEKKEEEEEEDTAKRRKKRRDEGKKVVVISKTEL